MSCSTSGQALITSQSILNHQASHDMIVAPQPNLNESKATRQMHLEMLEPASDEQDVKQDVKKDGPLTKLMLSSLCVYLNKSMCSKNVSLYMSLAHRNLQDRKNLTLNLAVIEPYTDSESWLEVIETMICFGQHNLHLDDQTLIFAVLSKHPYRIRALVGWGARMDPDCFNTALGLYEFEPTKTHLELIQTLLQLGYSPTPSQLKRLVDCGVIEKKKPPTKKIQPPPQHTPLSPQSKL